MIVFIIHSALKEWPISYICILIYTYTSTVGFICMAFIGMNIWFILIHGEWRVEIGPHWDNNPKKITPNSLLRVQLLTFNSALLLCLSTWQNVRSTSYWSAAHKIPPTRRIRSTRKEIEGNSQQGTNQNRSNCLLRPILYLTVENSRTR